MGGRAHVYVRLSGICEWDIAASVPILEAAGGHCIQLDTFGHTGSTEPTDARLLNGWPSHTDALQLSSKDYLQAGKIDRPTLAPRNCVHPGLPVPFNQEIMQSIMSFKAVGNVTTVNCWKTMWLDEITKKWKDLQTFTDWLDGNDCNFSDALKKDVKDAGPKPTPRE